MFKTILIGFGKIASGYANDTVMNKFFEYSTHIQVLKNLNTVRAWAFHSYDGLDEISIFDKLFFRYGNKIENKIFGQSIGIGINDFETFNGLKVSIDYSILFMDYIFDNINIISVSLNR